MLRCLLPRQTDVWNNFSEGKVGATIDMDLVFVMHCYCSVPTCVICVNLMDLGNFSYRINCIGL